MISMDHHYGAYYGVSSTPIWMMEKARRSGANGAMSSVNNIQAFREARGWSRPQLAKLMDTTPQQIERLEKGQRTLRQSWIDKAATAFDVEPGSIITAGSSYAPAVVVEAIAHALRNTGEVREGADVLDPTVGTGGFLTNAMSSNESVVTLRSFDLSYSMGPGTNIDDYVEDEAFQFDAGMLSKLTRAPAECLFVARGDGDSMFPTLLNEDTVVIDTTQKVVNLRDRIWACSIYGAGAIKRLRPSAEGKMEVISDNPAIKDDLVDAADIHIIGRVIWLGRRV